MEEEEIPSSSKKLNLLFGVKLIQLLNFVFLPLFIIHTKGMIFDSSVYDKKEIPRKEDLYNSIIQLHRNL